MKRETAAEDSTKVQVLEEELFPMGKGHDVEKGDGANWMGVAVVALEATKTSLPLW